MESDQGHAGPAECCPSGGCCSPPAASGRGPRVRRILFVLILLGAVALTLAALASRNGWLGDRAPVAAEPSPPSG